MVTVTSQEIESDLREHFSSILPPEVLKAESDSIFETWIAQQYRQPHRHYHTLQHLWECLSDPVLLLAAEFRDIAAAIFFHDVVYDPSAPKGQNEKKSAEALAHAAVQLGIGWWHAKRRWATWKSPIAHVEHWIAASTHDDSLDLRGPGYDFDCNLFLDLDLKILGAEPDRFDEYEDQVRREYSFVPDDLFRQARAGILRKIVGREEIYKTSAMQSRYGRKARANLTRSIIKLDRP